MEAKMEDKMKRTSKPDIIIKRKLVKRGRRKKCLLRLLSSTCGWRCHDDAPQLELAAVALCKFDILFNNLRVR